jgi:DNA mismatch endonuclease (patch repair protein)
MPDRTTKPPTRRYISEHGRIDLAPGRAVQRAAYSRGLRYRTHDVKLPGDPDLIFTSVNVAVFVAADFLHGWRYPRWRAQLSAVWRERIERTRARDAQNFGKLRCAGWTIVRIWEHEVHHDLASCIDRIAEVVARRRAATGGEGVTTDRTRR